MKQSIQAITRAFDEAEWKYTVEEQEDRCVMRANFNCKGITTLTIHYIAIGDHNDVALRAFNFAQGTEEKGDAVIEACNELNHRFRFARFSMKKDFSVNMEYDLPIACENVGAAAMEISARLVDIASQAYPVLMKAIWA